MKAYREIRRIVSKLVNAEIHSDVFIGVDEVVRDRNQCRDAVKIRQYKPIGLVNPIFHT
jgi:hypothetical protein